MKQNHSKSRSLTQIGRKLSRARQDGTLHTKLRHHAANAVYVPAISELRARCLPRSDRTLDLATGFGDHRGRPYELRVSDVALRRLIAAFAAAETDRPQHCPSALQVEGLWSEWLDLHYLPLRRALREEDLEALRSLLENLHRDSLSTGVGGTIDDLNRVPRPFLRSYYRSLWCQFRDLLQDTRPLLYDVSSPIVGNPVGVWLEGKLVQIDSLRHAHHATALLRLMRDLPDLRILEIGGGLGGQAYQTSVLGVNHLQRYTIIDIPEVACLSAYCLLAAHGEDRVKLFGEAEPTGLKPFIDVLPHWSVTTFPDRSYDLVYNSHSFSEMDGKSAIFYLREVERLARHFFFHINHETRYSYRTPLGGQSLNRIGSEMAPAPYLFDLSFKHPQTFRRPENRVNKGFAYLYRRKDSSFQAEGLGERWHWIGKAEAHQRVLFLSSSAELYGSDRAMVELASSLSASGHTVAAAVPYHGPILDAYPEAAIRYFIAPISLVDRSLRLHQLPSLAFRAVRAPSELIDIFRVFRPEVVYSNTSHVLDGPALSRAFRAPHLWHLREIERVPVPIRRLYGSFLLLTAVRVIAISNAVSDSYFGSGRSRVITVPDGIDLDHYSSPRTISAPQRYGPDRPLRLLSLGRLTPWKGQDVAVQAAVSLARQGLPIELRVVGRALTERDQGFERRLLALSRCCSAIHIEDEVDDVRPLYQWADVLLHTAVEPEPFGRVIVEAMAGGCAIVASDQGGPREIINHNVDGYLIQPGDPALLSSTLQEFLMDPNQVERLAWAARARANQYSMQFTADSVERVLQLVGLRPSRLGNRTSLSNAY